MLCHLFYFFKNPYTYHLASMISDDFRGLEPYYLSLPLSPHPTLQPGKFVPKDLHAGKTWHRVQYVRGSREEID